MALSSFCLVVFLIGLHTPSVAGDKTTTTKYTSSVVTKSEDQKRGGYIGYDDDHNHHIHRMLKKEKKKKEKAPKAPKAKKTKSPAPSVSPSTSPSVSPSDFPSVSIMPSDTPSQPPSVAPTPIPAEEVCLVTAQKFSLKGSGDEVRCNTRVEIPTYAGDDEAYYETTVGRVAILRENAGQLEEGDNCQVSYQFESVPDGATGNSVDAVCLKNTCSLTGDTSCNDQKAIIHYEVPQATPIPFSALEKVSYTYNPIDYGNGNIDEWYLNIYTITTDNDSQATPCTFYACKFDILTSPQPPTGSFTTFTIDREDAVIFRIQNTSCCNCGICPSAVTSLNASSLNPVSIKDIQDALMYASLDLNLGIANIQPFRYAFALNMGDTGGIEDNGMEICVDNLTYKLIGEDEVIFDFTL